MRVQFEVNPTQYQLRNALSERVAPEVYELLQRNRSLMAGSGKFTHKCACPNPEHKSGKERSASFYFNKDNGQFFCYGCNIYGNSFDLLKLLGEDPEAAFKKALEGPALEIKPQQNSQEYIQNSLATLNKKVRIKIHSILGTANFQSTFDEIQEFLHKIDLVLPELDAETPEQIHGRFLQFNMEFKRKFK